MTNGDTITRHTKYTIEKTCSLDANNVGNHSIPLQHSCSNAFFKKKCIFIIGAENSPLNMSIIADICPDDINLHDNMYKLVSMWCPTKVQSSIVNTGPILGCHFSII